MVRIYRHRLNSNFYKLIQFEIPQILRIFKSSYSIYLSLLFCLLLLLLWLQINVLGRWWIAAKENVILSRWLYWIGHQQLIHHWTWRATFCHRAQINWWSIALRLQQRFDALNEAIVVRSLLIFQIQDISIIAN